MKIINKKKMNSLLKTKLQTYKDVKTLEQRKSESVRCLSKFSDRIPVIIEKCSDGDLDIDRNKYLVPADFTLGQLVYIVRRRVKLNPERAMFVYIDNTFLNVGTLMSEAYEEHKDVDGFLYMKYSTTESVFG